MNPYKQPYKGEHSARINDPDKYDDFRRENNHFGAGIHVIFGIIEEPERKSEVQAIRFDADKFSVTEAKKWLREHDYKPILFEPAIKEEQTMKVPVDVMKFAVHAMAVGDNGEDAKSAPVELVALGGDPLDHYFFGPVVQDLEGMTHRNRIAIDYNHDSDQIIGYINKFSTEGGKLTLSGALTPFKDNDRATEIIHKSKAGVPYEASIFFAPSKPGDTKIEEVQAGEKVEVNGKELHGPLTVFRSWTLRGVAVCPYGADADTATHVQTQNQKEVEVQVMDKEKVEQTVEESKDSEVQNVETKGEVTEPKVESGETKSVEEQTNDDRAEFKQFVEAFGNEKAADYFAQGLSIADAHVQFAKDARKKIEELSSKVQSQNVEQQTVVPFDHSSDDSGEVLIPQSDAEIKAYAAKTGGDWQKIKEGLQQSYKNRKK